MEYHKQRLLSLPFNMKCAGRAVSVLLTLQSAVRSDKVNSLGSFHHQKPDRRLSFQRATRQRHLSGTRSSLDVYHTHYILSNSGLVLHHLSMAQQPHAASPLETLSAMVNLIVSRPALVLEVGARRLITSASSYKRGKYSKILQNTIQRT